jgi:hypothetical protein
MAKEIRVIECRPKGFLSRSYALEGDGCQATLKTDWLTEQGEILIDGKQFIIRKHGVFSGHWSLEVDGQEYASAKKNTLFKRTFDISGPMGELRLVAESMFTRCFRLESMGEKIATMRPNHMFTRHARIEIGAADFDDMTISFAFWLVLISWRRSQGSNSGGGS